MELNPGQRESVIGYAKDTLFDLFSKVALVNLMTGEFEFLKRDADFSKYDPEGVVDIFTYIRRQVDDGIVYPDHAADYLKYSHPDYVRKRVFSGDLRAAHSYRRRTESGSRWITFSVIAGEGCSPENPWALFCWRSADSDTITLVDGLATLTSLYYKILRVNLSDDTYEAVKTDQPISMQPDTLSGWFSSFSKFGNVFEDDIDEFDRFTDIKSLRERAKLEPEKTLSVRYRRKNGDTYRWVQMDLVPSVEYSDEHRIYTLYVKDIHDEYISELRSRAEMVEVYNRDALTLLYNRHKFNEDMAELKSEDFENLTVVYIDVNGLHELNNSLGHSSGDDMLCAVADALRGSFPDQRTYRIGGDEFIVLSRNLSPASAARLIAEVRSELIKDKYEIAVGIAGGSSKTSTAERLVGAAELNMRHDKEEYYKNNGEVRRRRDMNEQLEKILTEKRDGEFFLKLISKRFSGVYFVDLDADTVRHIYIPHYFAELLQKTDYVYSKALKLYSERYVKEEYSEIFDQVMDYDWLKQKLKSDGAVRFSYVKVSGKGLHLHILPQDDEPDLKNTVWIFADDDLTIG